VVHEFARRGTTTDVTRSVAVLWFRRDLRLADHPALVAAATEHDAVLPLFVVDPAFARSGAVRSAYLHDCLGELDASISAMDAGGLVIRSGRPDDVVPAVAAEVGAQIVYVSRDATPYGRARDERVHRVLTGAGRTLRGIGSPYAVQPGSVTKDDGTPYSVFTPFSKRWRAHGWDAPLAVPDVRWASTDTDGAGARPDPGCDLPPAGGRAARDRWREFVGTAIGRYADDRNLPGLDGTSRMSPALKWGTVHPRQLLADLDAAGQRGHAVFETELAWREFYADVLFRQPETAWRNLNRKMDAMPVDRDTAARERFDRWATGTTGFAIVDAGMRQLAATGWMHNRVRMIVASFLVKDLHLPWQWGARWFMEHLVDGDLASNNHGWQWTAGTGTDAAPYFRVFNPDLQQQRYDPDGAYVERWTAGMDDVERIVDHRTERDEALRRLASIS
jgi:deoxyribodipyrimidine photo-lyase